MLMMGQGNGWPHLPHERSLFMCVVDQPFEQGLAEIPCAKIGFSIYMSAKARVDKAAAPVFGDTVGAFEEDIRVVAAGDDDRREG